MSDSRDRARWQRIAALLDELLELPESERPARLVEACESDTELRSEVEVLLEMDGRQGILDRSPDDYLATLLQAAQSDRAAGGPRPGSAAGSRSSRLPTSASHEARFLPGTLLAGRYRIVTRAGRGGMGEVFRADDLKLGQTVALKFLAPEIGASEPLKARFLDEIRLARQVAHPNVCRVYDVGETEGQLFLSMEFIEGEDLASLLKRIGRLPREKAAQIAQQLCAGLAAAHAEGILHRDLKPANVMLDERGRVRITDFGLAGLAGEFADTEVLAGTPAYMSPEQLAGEGVSARSDLYALGLVLYELFTGRRAFEGRSWDEARRARERPPSTPSTHVSGLDPAIERVILRCLAEDPEARPSSALEVAAALPGGDPLATALAAGETPSPEMVAAAGPGGILRPRTAGTLLLTTVVLLGALGYLAPQASRLGLIPGVKPVEALVDDAREILLGLGYDEPPTDWAYFISQDNDYLRYLAATDTSSRRWRPLASPGQVALRFEYRQSPEPLMPLDWTGTVTAEDPPKREGEISVVTDLRGRLRGLQVVPTALARSSAAAAFDDWPALFLAAGLEIDDFQPAPPARTPRTFADVRAAWIGTLPELGLPVRIEAAAAAGRPTYFESILPSSPHWTQPGQTIDADDTRGRMPTFFRVLWTTFSLAMLGLPLILALRNLRLGRGDRRGANRLAAAVFILRLVWWVLAGHHVPRLEHEIFLLGGAVARSLLNGAMAWLLYVAIEPHARRLWPGMLISWSRLLAGRLRDPLVGQHVLVGVVATVALALPMRALYFLIPQWLGWPDPPTPIPHPMWAFWAPVTDPLLGSRMALAAIASSLIGALWASFGLTAILIGLLSLVRKKWIALPLFVVFVAPNTPTAQWSHFSWLGVTVGLLMSLVFCWFIARCGLLTAITALAVMWALFIFPITLDPTASYFGTSLFALAAVAALAGLGAWTAAGAQTPRPSTYGLESPR